MIIQVLNFPKYKTIVSCQINHPKDEGRGKLTIAHRVQAFSRKLKTPRGEGLSYIWINMVTLLQTREMKQKTRAVFSPAADE
jgi:hypothetical protein